MSGKIYLVQGEGQLVAMTEQAYDTEDVLQGLLANYPDLLAGEQINPESPRRWLLLSREASLPSEEGGAGRWSVDHLFVDQDGIPTIVEVKRSTDTRIRREVVGQMLDYAANAVVYWPVETLRAQFEAIWANSEHDEDEVIHEALGVEDADAFWQTILDNLRTGRIRMVFVADVIPPELRRVVEFLNEQMNPAEVIAVEVKQYVGQGQQALVSRAIGQTAHAVANKRPSSVRATKQWDEPAFIAEISTRFGEPAARTCHRIASWASDRQLFIWWGKGRIDGSMYPRADHEGRKNWLFAVWTYGKVAISFADMKSTIAFSEEDRRREVLQRLNLVPGIHIAEDRIDKYPSINIDVLSDPEVLNSFLSVFDWMIEEIRSA